ncbi:alpha/beta hydrolase [Aspergillus lucknowensis]|uniref:Alpha/Beta hydrolase protein n=1 Tax=Aspergillus lucknowensis TaxID=176173 RepID=A0ABR4LWY3_9EURO
MKVRSVPRFLVIPLLVSAVADARAIEQRSSSNGTVGNRPPVCQDFIIPVHAQKTIEGTVSLEDYDIDVLFSVSDGEVLVDGDYELSARFCEPPAGIASKDTLQVLLHGATFNKVMWDFPYKPEEYSWVLYMTNAGYSTLAIDFVGAGNSTKPNGYLEVQTATLVQNTHEVLQGIRSEGVLGRTFDQVALVGFSIGGVVANAIAATYPTDVDNILFLGTSWDKDWVYPAFIAGLQTAGNILNPDKWGNLDNFYQTQPTVAAREVACFFGNYDAEALQTDFETRDLDTLGAALSFAFHLSEAPEFRGPVFLGIGRQDSSFCPKVCGSQPYAIYDSFPAASNHVVRVYDNTGHALLYHHVAPQVIRDARLYLDQHSA